MISGTYENPWALLSCAIKVRSTSGANFGQVPSWKRERKIIEEEGRKGEREREREIGHVSLHLYKFKRLSEQITCR